MKRTVFFLSDSTGITAETLGHALLTQFDNLDCRQVTIPFVRDIARAEEAVEEIDQAGQRDGERPVVFSTLTNSAIYDTVCRAEALVMDLFSVFLGPLEVEFNRGSTHAAGRFHGLIDRASYDVRIEAVDFTLKHDDGAYLKGYDSADIILVGVSRSGKTPTCVYMSMQFGIRAANYPLVDEDLASGRLPEPLRDYRDRLFGLTIDAERLRQIRAERRPDSRYSSLSQCRKEVVEVETLLRREGVPFLNTSRSSVEEIATSVLHQTGLKRRRF
ncbi:MAG: posphoenolpyruvate synthetase regulatory kinase/phosphorylase PpsR [Gammaproteobacteria bacterium]